MVNSEQTYPNIVIMGNVASGKSTLLEEINNDPQIKTIAADELYQDNPFFKGDKFQDPKRWSFTSNTWFLLEKLKILSDIAKLTKFSPVLVDSGFEMSYVYGYFCLLMNYYSQEEFDLFEKLFFELSSSIMKPTYIVRLMTPIPLLLERIRRRGRQYEIEAYSLTYLMNLEAALDYTEGVFPQHTPVIQLDSTEDNHVLIKSLLGI